MKKTIIFLSIFLYADISNILLKIDKIEHYKRKFNKIFLKKCNVNIYNSNLSNNKISIKKTDLSLAAIFNNKALINNKWVQKGDIIDGYKVLKIYPKKVLLKKDKKIVVLKFDNILLKAE
jgi:hypothetical protein